MNDMKMQDYQVRVADILKVFRHKYGLKADLVSVNRQTIGTEAYKIMQTILEERNIAIEIDDRVAVGKFMFINRELAASDML
jgi:hypothetical protein